MITRTPLREQVYDVLVDRIQSGGFPPGAPLRHRALAEELEVSPTPIREALLRLAREGLVEAEAGRGFRVRSFDADEVRQKYPILWTLEGLALRACPAPSDAKLADLGEINRAMERSGEDPERLLELDNRWHERLLADTGNQAALELIRPLKSALRRYELAYMRDGDRLAVSTEHHEWIMSALAEGDLDAACAWLETNWRAGIDLFVKWMETAFRTH